MLRNLLLFPVRQGFVQVDPVMVRRRRENQAKVLEADLRLDLGVTQRGVRQTKVPHQHHHRHCLILKGLGRELD